MKQNNIKKAKSFVNEINKESGFKKVVVFGESVKIPNDFYDSLKFIVTEIGWVSLMKTTQFKELKELVKAIANELKEQKARQKEEEARANRFKAPKRDFKLEANHPKEEATQIPAENKETKE
ncbi:hypothetical protein CQA49_06835 [Helicobacter sp. MIT 00-7814]|uniref:hypothetical protein n=1 Tax=unclassified Helicobacter TaxID=2593540 RepID=UPI000E1EBDF0|nr:MULTISPECIES: hypothetical protein [unclassified Helicobacter]RDU53357.1 hypothetical protein CQA49_06835 [Helicobacter sp. MIT 00-7814]RDU54178.1 hypothetical protein CQA37_06075 [Helicobacter sp. MIT 99-10781]